MEKTNFPGRFLSLSLEPYQLSHYFRTRKTPSEPFWETLLKTILHLCYLALERLKTGKKSIFIGLFFYRATEKDSLWEYFLYNFVAQAVFILLSYDNFIIKIGGRRFIEAYYYSWWKNTSIETYWAYNFVAPLPLNNAQSQSQEQKIRHQDLSVRS